MKRSATGEAPGRLDFMGGVSDYSGALVLESPTQATTRVTITATTTAAWALNSRNHGRWAAPAEPLLGTLSAEGRLAREALDTQGAPAWAAYPLGCVWAFCQQTGWRPAGGLAFSIVSSVPEGLGFASSAALEVATLRALEELSGTRMRGTELARVGQFAENQVAAETPCGLMDQLTSAYGRGGSLLQILCQPDVLQPPIPLPKGTMIAGWSSGTMREDSRPRYAEARAATFAGKQMFEKAAGRTWNFAAEIAPSLFHRYEEDLPETIRGDRFLKEFGKVEDPQSEIDRRVEYRVRAGLRFAIEENFRSELAASLLASATGRTRGEHLRHVGGLMLQSHVGYSSLGLGSPETDRMVDAVMAEGPDHGIYGARASAGGSGRAVVMLFEKGALERIENLAAKIQTSGSKPTLVFGKE